MLETKPTTHLRHAPADLDVTPSGKEEMDRDGVVQKTPVVEDGDDSDRWPDNHRAGWRG